MSLLGVIYSKCKKELYMRNWWKMLFNTSLGVPGALAHRLQRRTACKIQNGRQWAPKWPTGSGQVSTPRFWGIISNFR